MPRVLLLLSSLYMDIDILNHSPRFENTLFDDSANAPILLRYSCINSCQFYPLTLCHVLILPFLIHEMRIMY